LTNLIAKDIGGQSGCPWQRHFTSERITGCVRVAQACDDLIHTFYGKVFELIVFL
jgi:hypothetical protein